jgi:hypothetical protein
MRILIALSMLAGLVMPLQTQAVDGKAVNGRAVSVQWRFGWVNWGAACCECYERQWKGSINLFTIMNGRVSGTDTIYRRTQGCAEFPAFNLDGNKVAFYRTSKAPAANEVPPKPSCAATSPKSTISVIDIDGKNLTDLCNLAADIPIEGGLDWPAGEWIYYVQPQPGQWGPDNNEIWKVNYRTKENVKVCKLTNSAGTVFTCQFLRRFQLNLAADRMGFEPRAQYTCPDPGVFGNNGVCDFPPPGGNVSAAHPIAFCGCNAAISASGNFGNNWCGGHNDLFIENARTGAGVTHITLDQLATWSGQGDKFGRDAELVRWAANSDKWVLQQVGWYGHADETSKGSNQVAANWKDQAAICISSNPKVPLDNAQVGIIDYGNCAGDMWIDGGAANAGKYEDENGVWHSVPGYVPTQAGYIPVSMNSSRQSGISVDRRGRVRIDLAASGPAIVRITDMCGRILYSSKAEAYLLLPAGALKSGMYLMTEIADGKSFSTKIAVWQ